MIEEETVKQLYDLAKSQGWLDKLMSLLQKKYNVLVLGSSGVGKTNLLQSLVTLTPEIIHHSRRTTDTTKSSLKIEDIPFNFIDTPGQADHSSIRMKAIRQSIGSLDAVLNVVCYGYHEYARGKSQAFTSNGELNPQYLIDNRIREIEALKEWSEILGGNASYRLITVVTKADLWWDDEKDAFNHYENGEYYQELGSCKQLSPMVIHHSSVFHKLYGVAPLSGSFDESDRTLARANLLKTLVEVVGKGGVNGD